MTTDPATAYAFNFAPNWREPFRVVKEYRTDIITTRSKREFRRALRSSPRVRFDFDVLLNDSVAQVPGSVQPQLTSFRTGCSGVDHRDVKALRWRELRLGVVQAQRDLCA